MAPAIQAKPMVASGHSRYGRWTAVANVSARKPTAVAQLNCDKFQGFKGWLKLIAQCVTTTVRQFDWIVLTVKQQAKLPTIDN